MKFAYIMIVLVFSMLTSFAQEKPGAIIPWTTYEAEKMRTNGKTMGPKYDPYLVETESSGQKCVKLATKGQFAEFTSDLTANSMVIRFSLPDSKDGKGTNATLGIYKNGKLIQHVKITSHYAYLYGKYPFTNDPAAGSVRNFYDEVRIKGLHIAKGDVVRVQRDDALGDIAEYAIIDLVDLENIAGPLKAPANSLSIADKSFHGNEAANDYTEAFRKCIAKAVETKKSIYIPAGIFKITGDIVLPANITIRGAGMWYTTLVGDEAQYTNADKRVRLKGNGGHINLSDFAIVGKLNYRNDNEANDGIVGSYGSGSTISRLWIEHTKVGMWIQNSTNLKVTGCRFRNTIADGINFCVGMSKSTIANCTARGTGDDCFAMWPATFEPQQFSPGHNLITHCTGQLPFLANGGAIYGGESNRIAYCSFTDISQGSAILISCTFPTEDKGKGINNNFSGTTVVENCAINTSGGFDHEWDWRAAIEICVDKRSISGITLKNITVKNSLSNGISVITKNLHGQTNALHGLSLQNVKVSKFSIGTKGKHGLFINDSSRGSMTIKDYSISDIVNESAGFTITGE